jgi:isoquinoline 1-oxidoreductase beta subunit
MLVAAAAARLSVNPSSLRTELGRVVHDDSGRSLTYGELAEAAATLPVPEDPPLKKPRDFRYIGKYAPRLDTRPKVEGKATYGIDVRVPGMLFATVVHSPVFGGSVKSFDATRARSVDGVRDVFEISTGVAVIAEHTWGAFSGASALDVVWDSGDFALSSVDISRELATQTDEEGAIARTEGDVAAAFRQATKRIEATYEVPYLAHATMEPMNCTADVRSDRCEIWAPTQNPQGAQSTAARVTGLPVEKVDVHVTFLGCGLGRRARTDYIQDAVETSQKLGGPVQVVWTREEDMQHDSYRPATFNRFEGTLDEEGRVTGWKHAITAPPVGRGGADSIDGPSVAGASNLEYAIPNIHVDVRRSPVPVPVGYWRSVGPSQNTFITESFFDEIAHAAGRDPFELRRELLKDNPRLRHVVELAAEKAGWGNPLPDGRAHGIAAVLDKGGYVAEVVEVSIESGRIVVHRVTCGVDCGQIIDPNVVEAQIVGSVVYGLSALLHGEITIEKGRVAQSNFHDYPILRIPDMPKVDVHIVDSTEEPGGVGEPGVPPIAPAVTNAIFRLTGQRIRRLPLSRYDFSIATDAAGS